MYLIGRMLVNAKYASLPNLFVDREVMPEFIFVGGQTKLLTPLTEVLHGWLSVDERLNASRQEMAELRERYVQTGATCRVAEFLMQRLAPAEAVPAAKAA